MVVALMIIEPILRLYKQECVITSGTDSKHSKNSRHYVGLAVDVRTRDIDPEDIYDCEEEIRHSLGSEFYVAFERNHFHIQFNGTTPT